MRHTRSRRPGWMLLAPLALAFQIAGEARQAVPPTAQSSDYFESKVRPVLAANCYDCHTDERMGGLRLHSRDGLLNGGGSGPPPAPAVSHASWRKSDIDRFVLARLEKEGLAPVRAADKRTLIRRATLDLTGLPPTPEDIEAFERDASPDAFAKVVDRLLASPQY